jgi:hypothetical protein
MVLLKKRKMIDHVDADYIQIKASNSELFKEIIITFFIFLIFRHLSVRKKKSRFYGTETSGVGRI